MSSQVLVSKIRRKYKETTLLKTRYFMLHLETKIQILYFCDKKYRRAIVTEMIIKPKLSTKRKDSHSRQHHSNLRSNSKSSQKNKQRSDSKLLLKLKQGDPTQNPVQPPKMYNYQVLNRINLKKATSSKQLDNDNEYYNHFKNKSKSKGKIQPLEEQAQRQKYLTSVYMHKDSVDAFSNSNLQQSNKCIEIEKPGTEKNDKAANTHLNIINKFKLIEKNCGIDANGKFTSRQAYKSQENTKNTESFNAISMFEVQKKTEKFKKKDKLRRDIVKSAKSKKIEDKLALKLNIIRSAEKTAKKKDFKQVNSPCLAECQAETEIFENGIIKQTEKEQKIPKVSFLNNIIIKTTLLQETRTSPNQIQDVQRVQFNINTEEIVSLIEEQKKCNLDSKKLKRIFPNDLLLQRKKCIKFISKICSDFGARREAHSLAIFYMDKYLMIIDQQVNAKQLKLIVMTSLLLALKMDDGIMARRVCHQYLSNMQNLINKCEVKNKSLQKQKQLISTFSSRQNSGSMIKSKSQSSFGDSNTTKGDQTKKSRNQQIVHSKQMTIILSLQLDIMMKFNFKMVSRSSTYWVDTLSALWDNYVCQEMKNEFQLLFRHEKNKRNLSHLYQIVQKMQQQLEFYQFSKPHIVLSSMYLIIRMRLQQQKEGQTDKKIYSKYSQSLNKSTNLIFYDNVGINELFGDFLEQLDMNISNLIECIRFVGKFLTEDFKTFSFNSRGKQILNRLYEHYLSIYQQNASLYKEEP